ncbi:MAG: enoyl-CoA hydratase [Desulfuromonadaceae bacterium]|nr:enoyl-CoA hydratase [Desulfuromonadaceae bacterium]
MTVTNKGAPIDMNSSDQIQSETSDSILTLRINRPDKKNALNLGMYQAMADGLRAADRDDAVRVILITGGEECFTSGNDLADFLSAPPTGPESPVMQFLRAISETRKPLVAAVNGLAVGIGVTMLLHCDLVYVGKSATFQMPFVNLGLCPEAGSTLLLPRIMGHQRAAELLLLGEVFNADTARSLGIITEVYPDGDVLTVARNRALQLAAQPAAAVRLAKELLKRDYAPQLRETIAEEGKQFTVRLKSPEAAEALQAFMQRRKPDFSRFW